MKKAFTVIEVFAALFLISVGMVCFMQLVFALQEQRQSERYWAIASDQLQNVLELALAGPDGLTVTEAMREMVERSLPDGTIELDQVELPGTENAALLQGTLTWNDGSNRPRKSVTMVRLDSRRQTADGRN